MELLESKYHRHLKFSFFPSATSSLVHILRSDNCQLILYIFLWKPKAIYIGKKIIKLLSVVMSLVSFYIDSRALLGDLLVAIITCLVHILFLSLTHRMLHAFYLIFLLTKIIFIFAKKCSGINHDYLQQNSIF